MDRLIRNEPTPIRFVLVQLGDSADLIYTPRIVEPTVLAILDFLGITRGGEITHKKYRNLHLATLESLQDHITSLAFIDGQ